MAAPVDLFISYAPADEAHRETLETHLAVLVRQAIVNPWSVGRVAPGGVPAREAAARLEAAGVVLLLVSPDFLASDELHEVDMKRALERHLAGEALVIPIVLRACDWQHAAIGHLAALPSDGKPITSWSDRDEAWKNVVHGVRAAVEELRSPKKPQRAQPVPAPVPPSLSSRARPKYPDEATRHLSEQLQGAVDRKAKLKAAGASTAQIAEEIVTVHEPDSPSYRIAQI